MKRLFALAIGLLCAFYADAQTSFLAGSTGTSGADSVVVTNTGTGYLYSKSFDRKSQNVFIQAQFTETSGTSAGTCTVEGTVDGSNWKLVTSTDTNLSYSYTVTDVASQSIIFKIPSTDNAYTRFRLKYVGSGTMVNRMKGVYLVRD